MDLNSFSVEQALKLTKHPKTSRDALKLSKPAFWKKTKRSSEIIWGEFKGKSIHTYQPRIGLNKKFYFKCNCSSRQRPCRHALALLIHYLERPSSFKEVTPSGEMLSWWQQLPQTQQNKAPKSSPANTQSASLTKRIVKMKSGVLELDNWLQDLMRQGLGQLALENTDSLDSIRQRLTDAGLGGLRASIDEIEMLLDTSSDWPELIIPPLARLKALTKGMERLDELKPEWQREILLQCGVYVRKEELESLPTVEDQWVVLWSSITEREDGGHQRKTWLYGQKCQRFALLLEFNFREPRFIHLPKPGRWFKAGVTFYPSPFPLRILLRWSAASALPFEEVKSAVDFQKLQSELRTAIKLNPWLRAMPAAVKIKEVQISKEKIYALDKSNRQIELHIEKEPKWALLAIAQDVEACILLGEFDGLRIKPFGLIAEKNYYTLSVSNLLIDS